MVAAAAYILRVPEDRREILLDEDYGSRYFSYETPPAGQPVKRFDHSRRAPLVVFACFEDGAITHIADGSKGGSAGRGLVVLNMRDLRALDTPIPFNDLLLRAPGRVRTHLDRVLDVGGKLPPKTLGALVDIVLSLQPQLASQLGRFSERRSALIARLPQMSRQNLALQKETVATALQIAGLSTNELLAWSPSDREQVSFLEGLPQAYVREDAAVIADFNQLPGFDVIKNYPFAGKVFRDQRDPSRRVTVLMANHLRLEEQTGADLIYYNEAFQSFVLVQYKSMKKGTNGPEFRWTDDDQLATEIGRLDEMLKDLSTLPQDSSPGSFRLHENPFFLKLCPRIIFNPDDKGLFQGMYLPLGLWRSLAADPSTAGPRGGRVIGYSNVERRFSNSEFVRIVANAWVGTTIPQSAKLAEIVRSVVDSGKTVTLAVKSKSGFSEQATEPEEPHEFDDVDAPF